MVERDARLGAVGVAEASAGRGGAVYPDRAVAEGLQHTGRIVTSAAMLLVVVFARFLVAGFVPIKELGLGLVLDATIVRMLLVPASMTLARKYNWWAPAPLRRLVSVLAE